MSALRDLEEFVQTHRPHGELTWWAGQPTPRGYQVEVACPCGVTFERWVLPWDAAEDCPPRGSRRPGGGWKSPLDLLDKSISREIT